MARDLKTVIEIAGDIDPKIAKKLTETQERLDKIDAAMKAADVKLQKLYAPPSETNFGGGLLSGTQSACEAACAAFAAAVAEVAGNPKGA